jgi:Ca2+-binding RTX toxin-like protein
VPKLDATTVFDDAAIDVAFGGAGQDWFLGNASSDLLFANPWNEQIN